MRAISENAQNTSSNGKRSQSERSTPVEFPRTECDESDHSYPVLELPSTMKRSGHSIMVASMRADDVRKESHWSDGERNEREWEEGKKEEGVRGDV